MFLNVREPTTVAGHSRDQTSITQRVLVRTALLLFAAPHTSNAQGVGYCFGDPGVGTPCPCGNDNDGSVLGSGCDNGVFTSGAQLTGSGIASMSSDTLVLSTTHLEPNNAGLYFQADNQVNGGVGYVWGSGLRCAGSNLKRLGVRFSDANGFSDTSGFAYTISAKAGNVNPGDTKNYQCWYRTTSNPPCFDEPFNTSNGYSITWALGGGAYDEMVLIPAGSFDMGDHHDGMSWALPVHSVYLDAFYMDKFEVRNEK